MRKYAIICGSRSGSTLLCDLLKSTRRAGNPEEFFNKSLNFDHLDNGKGFIDSIINRTKTENDVFGLKIVGREQLEAYTSSSLEITHAIYLKREDSLAQAISRYKSWKTGVWHLNKNNTKIPDIAYNYQDIKWCYLSVLEENEMYEALFSEWPHIKISYENDLIENRDQTINCILDYMNISTHELPLLKTNQKKVRNSHSEELKKQFKKDWENESKVEK